MVKINYDVILFDLDGTVIESLDGILDSINYSFENVGISPIDKKDLTPFIGPPIIHTLQLNYGMSKEEAEHTMTFYHKHYGSEGWKKYKVYDGVGELLKGLKVLGKKIGLATNKPRHYAQMIMENCGFDGLFDYIGGSDFENGITNKTQVIESCLEKMEIQDKSRVIMIGDRKFDVLGAKEAGISTLGITYGYGDRKELEEAGAIIVADEPREIFELF